MSFGLVGNIVNTITGGSSKGVKVNGTVVLMKKNVLDFNDIAANILDSVQDLLGQSVSFQLVSSTVGDPNNGNRGVVGDPAYLEQSLIGSLLPKVVAGESQFSVTFTWDVQRQGIPGAVIVKNRHAAQFLLKSLTLDDFPGQGRIHFPCNSWVYNVACYSYDRVFFANNTYKPDQTPGPLKPYREEELTHLRGDDVSRQLQEWDRVYNYAYYNDLGDPDLGFTRPILGGSEEYPYPRRGRTGRPATLTDPKSESRTIPLIQDFYVPRDERFGHLKASDFLGYSIKAVVQSLLPTLRFVFNTTPNEFDSYKDILQFYEGGLPLPNIPLLNNLANAIPFEMVKAVVTTNNGDRLLKFPLPRVLQEDRSAWVTDEEFAREMLAGVNPVLITRLREFPPTSNLDPSKYGDQTSTITAAHIESNLDGLTVDQALSGNKLYILDHHDALLPYLNRINSTDNKTYATRTVFYLKDDDTLKPVAVELSLPHPEGEERGPVSTVYTPSEVGINKAVWELAKAYVRVNDYGVHELISHWLNTHACVEPFVLSTNRNLSVVHPVYKLLNPHYRDTMNINALARQALINCNGIIELTTFPNKYSVEISSAVYKSWNFTEQALPTDLLKRGLAVEDPSSPNKVSLLIKDYPYAVDGLAIWSAIQTWVEEYCSIYYPSDAAVRADVELQAWWKEVREVGHGDKKNEPWWPTLQTLSELTQTCTTIIWMSSALHAAVNFGQYAFDGYMPNRPTVTRRLMPVSGSAEYRELESNPEKATLRTLSNQIQTLLSMSTLEILSTHASDEVYLGQRESDWTTDQKALDAFKRFGDTLRGIEKKILELNQNPSLKNRNGLVKVPYTLLYPSSEGGITEKGIPNSISI